MTITQEQFSKTFIWWHMLPSETRESLCGQYFDLDLFGIEDDQVCQIWFHEVRERTATELEKTIRKYNEEVHAESNLSGEDLYTLDESELDDYINWKANNTQELVVQSISWDDLQEGDIVIDPRDEHKTTGRPKKNYKKKIIDRFNKSADWDFRSMDIWFTDGTMTRVAQGGVYHIFAPEGFNPVQRRLDQRATKHEYGIIAKEHVQKYDTYEIIKDLIEQLEVTEQRLSPHGISTALRNNNYIAISNAKHIIKSKAF